MRACCLALLIGLGGLLPGADERITIDAEAVVRTGADRVLGINIEYLSNGPRHREDPGSDSLIGALRAMGVRWLRFPGGETADTHLFAKPPYHEPEPTLARTGAQEWPANDRRFTASDDGTWWPGLAPMDFDEFMAICRAVGAEPIIVLPYDSAYRAASPDGTKPAIEELLEHAVAWVRYANEIRDYDVRWWSLGNETDYATDHTNGNPGAARYAADLRRFAEAMHAVDPGIRLGAQGHSGDWFATVLAEAGEAVGFLDLHHYAGWSWTEGYRRYLETGPALDPEVQMARSALAEGPPATHDLPVVLSEFGVHDWSGGWLPHNDLGHALVLFDLIGTHLRHQQLQAACFWSTRWLDSSLTDLPLGEDLLAPIGLALRPQQWHVPDTVQADAENGAEEPVLLLQGPGEVQQDLPTDLLEAGRSYTLRARYRTSLEAELDEEMASLPALGIDLLRPNGGVERHAMVALPHASTRQLEERFRTPADITGARLWIRSVPDAQMRLADLHLLPGAAPSALDALADDDSLLPSGQVLALWNRHLQPQLLRAEATGPLRVWASRGPGRLSLWI
ncbi:MAG: hypothetical protein ACOCXJ_05080, partial [Planctomycetota bacterium]